MKTSSNNNNIESNNRVNNSRKQIKAEPKVGSREWYREKLTGEWERETMYFEYFDVHHDSCVEVHKPTHDGSPTGDRWQTDITVWGYPTHDGTPRKEDAEPCVTFRTIDDLCKHLETLHVATMQLEDLTIESRNRLELERCNARCKELEAEALAQMPYKVGDTVKSRDGVTGRVVEMYPEVTGDIDSPHLIYEYDGKPTVNVVILDAEGKRHCAHWSFFTLQEASEIKDDSFFTKGTKYRCIKDVRYGKDHHIAFKAGNIYEQDTKSTAWFGYLTNEQGESHAWAQPPGIEHFCEISGRKAEDIDPRLYFEPVEDGEAA